MGTLLIDRKDVELRRDGARLLIIEQGQSTGSVPISHLDRVVIQNRALLDTSILGALAENGIGLVIINPRHPQATATLPGHSHNDATRRISQYRFSLDLDWRRIWSTHLVLRKLRGQRLVLIRALERRPDQRHALVKGIRALEQRRQNLAAGVDLEQDQIRGFEGAAAAAYFEAYTSLFPQTLDFTSRNRRPPKDPVNTCLSLAYTLLHAEAVLALHASGLDPMLGYYHDSAFGRESLACDVIEPLRPHVDEWTWVLFRERLLRSEYFTIDKGACLLNKSGRKIFYTEWETCALPLRRVLRRSSRLLVKAFIGDISTSELHESQE